MTSQPQGRVETEGLYSLRQERVKPRDLRAPGRWKEWPLFRPSGPAPVQPGCLSLPVWHCLEDLPTLYPLRHVPSLPPTSEEITLLSSQIIPKDDIAWMKKASSGLDMVCSPVLGHVQLVAQQQSREAALCLLCVQSEQLQVAAAALEALAVVNAVHHQEGAGPSSGSAHSSWGCPRTKQAASVRGRNRRG